MKLLPWGMFDATTTAISRALAVISAEDGLVIEYDITRLYCMVTDDLEWRNWRSLYLASLVDSGKNAAFIEKESLRVDEDICYQLQRLTWVNPVCAMTVPPMPTIEDVGLFSPKNK